MDIKTIGASSVNSRGYGDKGKKEVQPRADPMNSAIVDALKLLRDGQWYKSGRLCDVARYWSVDYRNLLYKLPVAQSDNGSFVCWENENTPENSPKPQKH